MRNRLVCAACLAFLFASTTSSGSATIAQSRLPAPEEVEAAYLYGFGKYVEWPEDPPAGTEFVICVLGVDPFGKALDEIVAGKAIGTRPVSVRRILGPSESQGCQILFISPSEESRTPAILEALKGAPIVTVGHGPQFMQRGGMIAFTLEERKVRFVVNLAAAEAAGVRLSSQLLRVAVRVEQ